MRDLLADFQRARLFERPFTSDHIIAGLRPTKKIDAFVIEAACFDAPPWMPKIITAQAVFGLGTFPVLRSVRDAIIAGDEVYDDDFALMLWGTTPRSGRALFSSVATMGRGRVVRQLREAGWQNPHLIALITEWLDAARVHRSCRKAAIDTFLNPRAPACPGKTDVQRPTFEMRKLANELVPLDRDEANDLATIFAWIVARSQGGARVVIPSTALTQGRKKHVDSPGVTTQRGRKLWPMVRDTVLTRTRGHSSGKSAAEYEIRPEFIGRLINNQAVSKTTNTTSLSTT